MLDLGGACAFPIRAANARRELSEILLIAFAATLGGAESCVDMAAFAAAKQEALGKLPALKHGIPSHGTFGRVFKLLEPTAFAAVFRSFMAAFAAALSRKPVKAQPVLAIDGEWLHGAVDAASRTTPLRLVTAWAADQRLVLS